DADDAGDRAGLVVERNFRDRGPAFLSIAVDDALQFVDERLSREDDALFVVEEFLGEGLWVKIKVGFAKNIQRVLHSQPSGHGGTDAQKARLHVLEINAVGNVIE